MKITEVQIEFIKPNNGMIGFASLMINDSIFLSSIGIHKKLNAEGYRLTKQREIFNILSDKQANE